ncbi:MAG: ABC transporter permease, partial [Clostridia bacterium]|nr:ABC transporter permease [Clostridia bacterium]
MRKRSGSTGQRNKGLTKGYKLLPTLFIFLLILVWQGYVVLNKVPRFILPEPIMVLRALYEERSLLLTHTLVTLMEAAIGFGLSVLLSCLFGVVMGYFELVRRIFYPIFILSQTIPLIVMAPLFAIWFGFGLFPKILIVVLVCF